MLIQPSQHRRYLLAVYAVGVVVATLQRGVWSLEHTTFAIFRQSFLHLVRHQSLYAAYPLEQGDAVADLFKYSPSAAMLFAPLSAFSYPVALLGWNLLNAGLLIFAVTRLLPPGRANLALLLLAPEVFVAIQSSSSNGLVTALILLGALAYESGHLLRGGYALAVAASLKIFPLAAFIFAMIHTRRRRAVIAATVAFVAVLALPLLVVGPSELLQQYRWWMELEASDARDMMFGLSLMRQLRHWWELDWPNWVVQVLGTIVFLIPMALRRDRWDSREFRLHYLCSLLIFVVLFNHQAERQSFIIAATGAVIWFVTNQWTLERALLVSLALIGVPTFPYLVLWLVIHVELLRGKPLPMLYTPKLLPLVRERIALRRGWSGAWRKAS
jgi:hypothetical protein